MCSPKWLFLEPGKLLVLLGLIGYALALPGVSIHGVNFELNTLMLSSLSLLVGWQAILFAISAKTFAIREGLMPPDSRVRRFNTLFTVERGAILGAVSLVAGLLTVFAAFLMWAKAHFGNLNVDVSGRLVITGSMLTAIGFQTVLASFFLGVLRIPRRDANTAD
jgi:hypothetical protein